MKTSIMKCAALAVVVCLTAAFSVSAKTVDEEVEYNKYLISKTKDDNLGIRTSAMQLLGERKCDKAVKSLLWSLRYDKEYSARITAALALYKIGDTRVLPELKRRAKNDRNKTVRHVLCGVIKEMETTYLVSK